MINFILGATIGIYVYKKFSVIGTVIDSSIKAIKNKRFEMLTKIVCFEDGKYAIRRIDFVTTSYRYLDSDYPAKEEYWWINTKLVKKHAMMNLEQAITTYEILRGVKTIKSVRKASPKGTPIN